MIQPQRVQEVLQNVAQKFSIPCLNVTVAHRDSSVTLVAGVLPDARKYRYEPACVKKLMLSLIALRLASQGILDLNAASGELLSELSNTEKGKSIRAWHLLSNSSGYGTLPPPADGRLNTPQLIQSFIRAPQFFEPGTVFNYKMADYFMIAEILRRMTGKDTSALAQEHLLEPLQLATLSAPETPTYRFDGMSRRFCSLDAGDDVRRADSMLIEARLTTEDLAALGVALAGDRLAGSHGLTDHHIHVPHARESQLAGHLFVSYAMGCGRYADGTLGHSGSSQGQCCALRFDPARQFAVAIGVSAYVPQVRDQLLSGILQLCGYRPTPNGTADPSPGFHPEELAGDYLNGENDSPIEVRAEGNALRCRIPTRQTADIVNPDSAPYMEVALLVNAGRTVLQPSSRHIPVCFFRNPVSGAPCLMLGAYAFTKRAAESA